MAAQDLELQQNSEHGFSDPHLLPAEAQARQEKRERARSQDLVDSTPVRRQQLQGGSRQQEVGLGSGRERLPVLQDADLCIEERHLDKHRLQEVQQAVSDRTAGYGRKVVVDSPCREHW